MGVVCPFYKEYNRGTRKKRSEFPGDLAVKDPGSGYCCGMGLIPGPGTSTCHGQGKKKKKEKKGKDHLSCISQPKP